MTILNLTTFLNACENRLVYYNTNEYNLFTNGIVLYACKDDNPNLPKLMDNIIFDSTGRNQTTFEPILEALNNKHRDYVVYHVKGDTTTKVITKFNESKDLSIHIANRYYRTIKKKGVKKEFFIITIPFTLKTLECYFSQSLTQDEFIFIMPNIKK